MITEADRTRLPALHINSPINNAMSLLLITSMLITSSTALAQMSYEDIFGDHPKMLHAQRMTQQGRLSCGINQAGTTRESCERLIKLNMDELSRERAAQSQTAYFQNHKVLENDNRQYERVLDTLSRSSAAQRVGCSSQPALC